MDGLIAKLPTPGHLTVNFFPAPGHLTVNFFPAPGHLCAKILLTPGMPGGGGMVRVRIERDIRPVRFAGTKSKNISPAIRESLSCKLLQQTKDSSFVIVSCIISCLCHRVIEILQDANTRDTMGLIFLARWSISLALWLVISRKGSFLFGFATSPN